ncbi:MAG TPA: aspartate kinase [Candidatus Limnocylindrales bacterium]|nr:aspartate kinase [Candidatus Limnocylindrales bacterium]
MSAEAVSPATVVAKYGGSSLQTPEHIRGVAGRLVEQRADGAPRVVVVSAMGDRTDELLALANEVARRPDPRELDLLLATGELISAALLVMALHERGVEAISLTGPQAGITTDGTFGRARITGVEPVRIRQELDAGRLVVVAGFQGSTGAEIATLGRGGSDTSAVALAVALGAARCEIYTDVYGVYSADPRLVPDARLLPEIGFEEMLEMAHQGAKVLQTRSVELAWIHGVEIAVRHSTGDGSGTTVKEVRQMEARQKVRGIATEDQLAKLTLIGLGDRPGMAASVFAPLAEAGIPIDSIIQNVGHGGTADLSFIVPEADLDRAQHILAPVLPEIGAQDLTVARGLAKVSIVGAGIHNAPTYPARMFAALGEAGANIEMISTSEIRITCVIASAHLAGAARALHRAFELEAADGAG